MSDMPILYLDAAAISMQPEKLSQELMRFIRNNPDAPELRIIKSVPGMITSGAPQATGKLDL